MSFFAVLLALLIEQVKPLPRVNRVGQAMGTWVSWVARKMDAGQRRHARTVWAVSVLLPAGLAALIYLVVRQYSLLLAMVFDVALLYMTLGFRQFSHYFTDIRDAIDRGDEAQARQQLAQWKQIDASDLARTELLRQVLEHALLAAHRHVFGVFFWFVVLSALGLGPAGAVLYRMSQFVSRHWLALQQRQATELNDHLPDLARSLFCAIDLVPSRLTAAGFAVVGNFEEAVNAWRRDRSAPGQRNEGVILAAAAGAVGVQLGPSVVAEPAAGGPDDTYSESGGRPGAPRLLPPQAGHLQSMVGLVWRSVVLWMLLVALLTLANVLG
ncbi:MAG: CobD/CbiB family protein [Betaproteobacteria bacterium]|jgi:adenosylcobinamide-phosphate synthase